MVSALSWKTGLIRLVAVTTVLILGVTRAEAQIKPLKINGAGIVDYIPSGLGQTPSHWAIGNATELGKYSGKGKVQLDDFSTGAFSSAVPFVCEAANGDKLAFNYAGLVQVFLDENGVPYSAWVAEFTPALAQCFVPFQFPEFPGDESSLPVRNAPANVSHRGWLDS